ncbi:NHS-like protein 1 isoform X3 [Parambassis ranga]|uniref:NHS-like protein 1 isoform X3 n=1 Tax=Parambassis ranga TaxID=210632 RepID=A0A6P7HBI5_9TELE|nr:NHS-like protein 1 isoform X3 [Parambassis ranga]
MRGDRRSASFRKEKPAGLTRALSWLSVSTLSRQSRRIFHSQNELHVVHRHHSHSHSHLHTADRGEDEDDDNWVYQPQHKIEPVVNCWHKACFEDAAGKQQTLCSFQPADKMGNSHKSQAFPYPLPTRPECCLRKRLLSVSKVYQKQDSLWIPKPLLGPTANGPPGKTQTYQDRKAVSNLDEESKWTVHYTAPWHQQENVFLPGSRPPCVEDLHRQAKVNLKTALRECDKLRKDGFRSSQYYSQGPTFSDPLQSTSSLQDDKDDEIDKKSTASSVEDNKSELSMRSQTTQGGGKVGEMSDVDGQVVWNKATPLPTPEEKMRLAAQAVPTDIVPINVTAAKGRGGELRPHSMFIPGQYSTLGRVGSINSTLRHSETRDSSCQTEEVKVVPPSMRRIRAQRGQGIAAQMAGISASTSTGSISISSSDSSGIMMLQHQFNRDPSRFHSLPRQGARVSLSADPIYSSTPIKSEEQPQRQIGKLQVDNTVVHMRNIPRTGTLPRPKSQEVRGTQSSEWGGGPACAVSPHAAYSTSFIPNATLSSSSEVITLNASGQLPHSPVAAYPTARPLSQASSTNNDSLTSSPAAFTHSSTCPALATSTPNHAVRGNGLILNAPGSESGHSDSSVHSHSTLAPTPPSGMPEEQWIYDTPENVVVPHRTLTSSCSTPINQLYSSLDLSSRTTTDSSSLYSQDNDGYYTSMHMDSGLRSRNHGSGHGAAAGRATRHSMYECREMANQEDSGSLYSDRSLSRSISLRKSKKPPLPPARTDSLRRKPDSKKPLGGVSGGANEPNGSRLNESLIASLQQSLQMGLRGGKGKGASPSSPSHSPSSDYDDPWVLRPRSQSSISAGSSAASLAANTNGGGVSNVYSLCHVTPTQSETSSLRSDYADSWGYYMDFPRNSGDQRAQTPPAHTSDNMSAGIHPGVLQKGGEIHSKASGAPDQEGGVSVKSKPSTSSPDRVHRLTSPSSGYSSQSNTPTAGTPVPAFVRSMSPSGSRPKPKVPERKSSLLSSVSISSSSTSLSSNTSDSLKSFGPPPPPPPPLPLSSSAPNTPLSPPPPFPPPLPPSSNTATPSHAPAPPLPTTPQGTSLSPIPACSTSPEFPPPPSPEMMIHSSSSFNGSFSRPPFPPPPVPFMGPPPPPPLPAFVPASSSPSARKAAKDAPKPPLSNSPTNSPKPLITPFALQSVQLRSVKRPEKEINGKSDHIKAQETGMDLLQGLKPVTLLNSSPEEDLRHSSPSPVSQLLEELSLDCSITDITPDSAVINGKAEDQSYFYLNGKEKENRLTSFSPPQSCESSPVTQKPLAVSKKPKLSFLSPYSPQPINEQVASQHEGTFSLSRTEDQVDAPQRQTDEEKKQQEEEEGTSESSEPLAESSEASTEYQDESTTSIGQETSPDDGLCTNGQAHEEEEEEGDGTSSTTGSISSKEDDTGEVFESSTAESSPAPSANGASEEKMVTPTPTRARTTEDLFAVIHRGGMQWVGTTFLERSKRKVLGRRESDEDKSRGTEGNLQSPPVTPTSMSPGTVSSLPRQTGSIQRNLRKSSTSSDTFKALLLKKGSRSETSFRMSAAEMLRSTDPRFHRTHSESALDSPLASPSSPTTPHSPSTSPGRGKRAMDEWSRYDALGLSSPTSSPFSMSGSKYGRSRTPPSAASSKYNARSRILSSPMTVICEREGELAESEYGDTAESLPVLKDSNGTLSEESRS